MDNDSLRRLITNLRMRLEFAEVKINTETASKKREEDSLNDSDSNHNKEV